MEAKDRFRQTYRNVRRALAKDFQLSVSANVAVLLMNSFDWSKVKSVCTYKAIAGSGEICPSKFIEKLKKTFPKIIVFEVPAKSDAAAPAQAFNVILVPLVAFDKDNHRIGQGGGWYDKFLLTQKSAIKIGLGYDELSAVKLPVDENDHQLDYIVTQTIVQQKNKKPLLDSSSKIKL